MHRFHDVQLTEKEIADFQHAEMNFVGKLFLQYLTREWAEEGKEEREKTITPVIQELKSYYDYENKTLMDSSNFKSNLMKYNKIHQKNFWKKWYDIELKEKQNMKKKENEENEEGDIEEEDFLKQKTLFSVCSNMIELEIPKTTIKNICDEINDLILQNNN